MSTPHFPPPPAWAGEFVTVGVTGTNGKTSTTRWIAAALAAANRGPVARVTTVGSFVGDELLSVEESYDGFLETLRTCRSRGGSLAALEVTSEALAVGFAQAWPIQVGVFTNLSHDHLDAHRSAEHYLASKAQLFVHLPRGGAAVLNAFDEASLLLREVLPEGVRLVSYGVPSRSVRGHARSASVDALATSVQVSWEGTEIALAPNRALGLPTSFKVRAVGEIFAENALAALCAAVCAGVDANAAAAAISSAEPPEGRFELVAKEPYVVIDYAHTPDALGRTLKTARALARGDVVVVFGAGGNRDVSKRAAMGEAARLADRVLLTSDNPRDEDPAAIASAIREGLKGHRRVEIILDRRDAIRTAIQTAHRDDVIVVAGKGHERTQTTAARVVASSDRDLISLARRALDP